MMHRTFHPSLAATLAATLRAVIATLRGATATFRAVPAVFLAFVIAACATTQMPFHGFSDQSALDKNDAEVTRESAANGPLDPMNLAQDDQEYTHGGIAYDRIEEGYYQWGAKLYGLGYRDVYYVEDFAPKAFGHEMEDTYEHAIEAGFKDAAPKQ